MMLGVTAMTRGASLMFSKIRDFFFVLFHPEFWVQNFPYSREVDEFFINGISQGAKFTSITEYTAFFCGKLIWIENHPYASFRCIGPNRSYLASRATRNKLMRVLMESLLEECENSTCLNKDNILKFPKRPNHV